MNLIVNEGDLEERDSRVRSLVPQLIQFLGEQLKQFLVTDLFQREIISIERFAEFRMGLLEPMGGEFFFVSRNFEGGIVELQIRFAVELGEQLVEIHLDHR